MNLPTYKNQVNTRTNVIQLRYDHLTAYGEMKGRAVFFLKKSYPNLIEQEYLDLENEKNGKYE